MAHHYLSRKIFLGCILVVFSGIASADVVQPIDNTGTDSYMDVPRRDVADAAPASALANRSAVSAKVSSQARAFAAARKAREAAWTKRAANNHGNARDVATLEAARSSLVLADNASSLLRQQKLAALEKKDLHWFSF
jgi:hypothetical protein